MARDAAIQGGIGLVQEEEERAAAKQDGATDQSGP